MNRITLGLLAIMLLPAIACSTLLNPVVDSNQLSPGEPAQPAAPAAGEVVMEDSFDDPSSGWEVGSYDTGSVGYEYDKYQVEAYGNGSTMWGVANREFADVVVEVRTEQVSAPNNDNNDYGVMCRVQENGDGYSLLISGDGYFSIQKATGGSFEQLLDWTSSDVIQQGNAINQLRATCQGSTLSLEVNGQQMGSVSDSEFSRGDVALTATSYEEEATQISFDDLRILTP